MSTQISFSLRVSTGVKTVHLVGSWDNYNNQLPLSRDKASSSGKSWRGTFRFNNLKAGDRYWYYYTVDGYHCAVNPKEPSIIEPTTGRELNILDVPSGKPSSSSSSSSKSKGSSKHSTSSKHKSSSSKDSHKSASSKDNHKSRHLSVDIPKGRPLPPSEIKSPKPVTPHAAHHILRYDEDEIDTLAAKFGGTVMIDEEGAISSIYMGSPASSSAGSSFYRSDTSSPSSGSGYSTPSSVYSVCTCENYGITRRGDRVKIDCGGRVCGYYDDCNSSDCSSSSEAASPVHRRAVVIR